MARPTDYKEEYIDKVDEYLAESQDEEVNIVKQENAEKGYQTYDHKLRVKLPTIEGFARYIGVNKTTLYEWEKAHPEFSNALEKIRTEQKQRLIDMGLSGDYNSTIAKLILSSNHGMTDKVATDLTSGGKPIPILSDNNALPSDNSNSKDNGDAEAHPGNSGGNISQQDSLDTLIPDPQGAE